GTIDINVRLNGAEMLEGSKEVLGKLASNKVAKGINDMLKQYFPQLNRKSGLHKAGDLDLSKTSNEIARVK
ncbi:hypothetical protein CL634_09655, partial [bacterium]|nr:hypothetical protein [bacterium]